MTKEQEIEIQGVTNALLFMKVLYASDEERQHLLKMIEASKGMDANAKSISHKTRQTE